MGKYGSRASNKVEKLGSWFYGNRGSQFRRCASSMLMNAIQPYGKRYKAEDCSLGVGCDSSAPSFVFSSFFVFLSAMAAFKLALVLLVFSAGPTIAVIRAVEHRHPATYAHIAHNRQTLCRPRPLYSSPKSDLPASIATNGTAVQAEPLPDYTTATNADADAGVESHIPTAAIATTALDPDHVPSSLPSASSSSRLPKAKTTTTPGHSSQHISLTPNGIKAGVAGGDAYNILRDHIGWWYDWSAHPSKPGEPIAVPMLWGSGHADATDARRLEQFERLSSSSSNKRHPKYVLGYEEPDCTSGGGSSGMGVDEGVREWERLIAPLKGRGTKIGSPSMCSKCSIEYLYGKMRIYHSVCFQSRRMRRSSKNLRAKFRCPGILLRFMLTRIALTA